MGGGDRMGPGPGMQDSQGLEGQEFQGEEGEGEDMENVEGSEMQSEGGEMSNLPINLSQDIGNHSTLPFSKNFLRGQT